MSNCHDKRRSSHLWFHFPRESNYVWRIANFNSSTYSTEQKSKANTRNVWTCGIGSTRRICCPKMATSIATDVWKSNKPLCVSSAKCLRLSDGSGSNVIFIWWHALIGRCPHSKPFAICMIYYECGGRTRSFQSFAPVCQKSERSTSLNYRMPKISRNITIRAKCVTCRCRWNIQ